MIDNIRDLLEDYHVNIAPEGHHHSRPGWAQIDCPLCGKVDHFRMGINEQYNSAPLLGVRFRSVE